MTMKAQPHKIYGMQQKQLLQGSSQQYNAFFKTQEKSQITSILTHHPKECEKEQTKPQASRSKQTLKIREEINKIEITGEKKPTQ